MTDHPDLTALLGSRICHDLISPIGAIGNGVELMLMDSSTRSPEMALISESVASASARIRFFRIAFGLTTGDQLLAKSDILSILNDMSQGARIVVDWQISSDILRREAKLGFLAIQCLETALAFGGRITVQIEAERWCLTAVASRIKIDPNYWELLSNPNSKPEITPAFVQFALLADALQRQSRRLTAEICETEIKLSF